MNLSQREAPIQVLAIGGLEPSGAAGLLADVWAIHKLHGRASAVASALTVQSAPYFQSQMVSAAFLQDQVSAVLRLRKIRAVKLGMVPGARALQALQAVLPTNIPWVVDPVVQTSLGEPLSTLTAAHYRALGASHVFLTPNATEAGWLLGDSTFAVKTLKQAMEAARALLEFGFGGVVVKGGHLKNSSADVVGVKRSLRVIGPKLPRLARGHAKRGTGCRYASALATTLGRRLPLEASARAAQRLVRAYLQSETD